MSSNDSRFTTFLQLAQNAIALIIGLAALIPISGLIVFSANLSRYTDLYGFDAKPNFYAIAGFSILFATGSLVFSAWLGFQLGNLLASLLDKLLSSNFRLVRMSAFPVMSLILLLGIWSFLQPSNLLTIVMLLVGWALFASVFVLSGFSFNEKSESKFRVLWSALLSPSKTFLAVLKNPFTMTTLFLFLISTLLLVFVGLVYGLPIYSSIASSIGGGKPSEIVIVFNNADALKSLGLTVGSDNQTTTMCLLAELMEQRFSYCTI